MNNITDELYSTRDLVLATYLALKGAKLAGGYEPASKSWIFKNLEMCEDLSLELRNGDSCVEVLAYESTRRNLLGMVHDKKA